MPRLSRRLRLCTTICIGLAGQALVRGRAFVRPLNRLSVLTAQLQAQGSGTTFHGRLHATMTSEHSSVTGTVGTKQPRLSALPRLLEIKKKASGQERSFELEKWLVDIGSTHTGAVAGGRVVGRWLAPEGNPYGVVPGTFSWGVWWQGTPLGAYRLHSPAGGLQSYRFDVLHDVEIEDSETQSSILFHDLFLDAWVRMGRDGKLQDVELEDEDELNDALKENVLSTTQLAAVKQAQDVLADPEQLAALLKRVDDSIDDAIAHVKQSRGTVDDLFQID
eukprot:TRINITY_DN61204_c0_g1_i1.p1 TRINITY_DN61204_c0_g1~~TRINITY_DN61204_c0_g1_i1.p1  ORF type:complete len:302 (-),score=25.89 TRINITY_DN61204_c0_g1_i1:145-975(-)